MYAGASVNRLRVYNKRGEEIVINVPIFTGGHGGADEVLQRLLFRGGPDPLNYVAGSRAGAMSLIIGAAANRSIQEGRAVFIRDLLKDIG